MGLFYHNSFLISKVGDETNRDGDFCGAAVAVGVGSYDEPIEAEGLKFLHFSYIVNF